MIIMKLKCLFRDVIDIMSEGYRVTKERDYLVRLNYAMSKLSVPLDDKQLNHDRFLTLEAVRWLFEYYNKDINTINNAESPDVMIAMLLSKRSTDVTDKDYIFIKVLYDWKIYKRVEGY